ncbi:MAG: hypothetical protein K2Z81_03690, partial [Cyanobacteria bacterium]|nr:hypothetical protein [Cyanobacteriota bacterium]
MVEMTLSKATNSLDSKLNEIRSVLNDDALNGMSQKSSDAHYRNHIEGIRSALNGDFDKAASILLAEHDFIKQHPTARAVKE